jgi:hypothetical protein
MLRTLLALFLAIAAAGALAAEPTPVDSGAPQCEKGEVEAGKPGAGTPGASSSSRPGTPAPVRPRSASGRSTPRWHSLLPGMIR